MAAAGSNSSMPATSGPNVNHLWPLLHFTMNTTGQLTLFIQSHVKSIIGDEGVNSLVLQYKQFIEAPVMVTEDVVRGYMVFAPANSSSGQVNIDNTVKKSREINLEKADKIPRPPNAFILFRAGMHEKIKQEHPGIHNNEISKILGRKWKAAGSEVRDHFKMMAEVERIKHAQAHPHYVYQPRKQGEKKKRMTRSKLDRMFAKDVGNMNLITTRSGNGALEVGKKKYETKNLRSKIQKHNQENMSQNSQNLDRSINLHLPTSHYTERSLEYQDQVNFADALLGMDTNFMPFPNVNEAPAYVSMARATAVAPSSGLNSNTPNFDRELARMNNL